MATVFQYCAVLGGALLVLQFLLLLFGVGADHATGGDLGGHGAGAGGHVGGDPGGHEVGHDQSNFLRLISLQTLTTFATFFGLVGLCTESAGWSPVSVAAAAAAAGVAALWFVARCMRALSQLHSAGNVDLQNAVGSDAKVYLRIPAAGHGHGRVLVNVQQRTVECPAVSRGGEIPTGAIVRVCARADDDVLVVEQAAP
jgi:membrane protein implicated in regulation of membrane protease activity